MLVIPILNTINTDQTFYLTIMQHFSDCDRIYSKHLSLWTNSYLNRMQFDLKETSSQF
jgi:hypothetical protein